MSHKSKVSLFGQAYDLLIRKFRPGESKYEAKQNGTAQLYIYSIVTLRNYLAVCRQFTAYCKAKHRCKTIFACREYVNEYLLMRNENCSAWSVKRDASALAKLYGCTTLDFVPTKDRVRADIRRSRYPAARDRYFSEANNADLVAFCKSTGLRRSELEALRGDDYEVHNGALYIHVRHGKGGRERLALVVGDKGRILAMMDKAGHNKVFARVHSGADVHGYRADYACALYKRYARPIETLPKKERYYCRTDQQGAVYDRNAMLIVSRSLGHNREDVIARSYLYRL